MNLAVLAKNDPGWNGLALYDRMQRHLKNSAQAAEQGLNMPMPSLALGGLSGLNLPGSAFQLPKTTLKSQAALLAQLQQNQLRRLLQRQAQEREEVLRSEQKVWRVTANEQYVRAVAAAQAAYEEQYSNALEADSRRRLNLALQIKALNDTITSWKLSVPPAPLLAKDEQDLTKKEQALALLKAQQTGGIAALKRSRAEAQAQAFTARTAYLANQQELLETRLAAQDARNYAAQQEVLNRQASFLLSREQHLVAAAVPTDGTLGAVSLPRPQALPIPEIPLQQAEDRLSNQRTRWVRDIYQDAQRAAVTMGKQQGWEVYFDPQDRRYPDRTKQVAALLAGSSWKR